MEMHNRLMNTRYAHITACKNLILLIPFIEKWNMPVSIFITKWLVSKINTEEIRVCMMSSSEAWVGARGWAVLTRYSRTYLDTKLGLWIQSSWEELDSVWIKIKSMKVIINN